MTKYITLLFILLITGCSLKNKESGSLFVGASARSITPSAGAFIAGDEINRRFTGIHDSLYVKAVVVSDSENSFALLSFDCIGMLYPTLTAIRKEVASLLPLSGFDPARIVMASTHTHEGPDVVGIWGPDQMTSGVDTAYMRSLISSSAEAIATAWKNKQPAKAGYGISEFGKEWVYNISDSLNLDRTLSVIQFKDYKGRSIATISNFACHPTIMDGATTLASADYVNGMYTYLNHQLGGVNMFLQGAVGGWVQPEYEAKDFATATKRGTELGEAIENVLKNQAGIDPTSVRFKSRVIELPVSNPGFRQLSSIGVIQRTMTDSVSTEIACFSIGNAMFLTHPGETTPTHSKASREMMKTTGPKFVIGLGMDGLGYILTPEFYAPETRMKHIDYLSGMSVDQHAGSVLMDQLKSLTNE